MTPGKLDHFFATIGQIIFPVSRWNGCVWYKHSLTFSSSLRSRSNEPEGAAHIYWSETTSAAPQTGINCHCRCLGLLLVQTHSNVCVSQYSSRIINIPKSNFPLRRRGLIFWFAKCIKTTKMKHPSKLSSHNPSKTNLVRREREENVATR